MGFKDITNKLQKAASDYKQQQADKKAAEEARRQAILAGSIDPVQVSVNLQPNELAFASFQAKRLANVDHTIQKTTGKTKKKGVITRGIVGGALLGPVGLIAGAATAGSKTNTQTTEQTVTKHEVVDSGVLVLTNQRLLFVGNSIINLPYADILAYGFSGSKLSGMKLTLKYESMLPNEQFALSGALASDAELYYRGITNNLLAPNA